MYSKQTETAIASASRLAEVYDGGITRLSATNIADSRGLQRPFVAKILTMLSQAGLVSGAPGPGGGYTLTRPPKKIRLYDIYRLFEREDNSDACPFGGGVCGVGEPCPLHNKLVEVQDATDCIPGGWAQASRQRRTSLWKAANVPRSKQSAIVGRKRKHQNPIADRKDC